MNPGNGTETCRGSSPPCKHWGRNQMNPGNGTETKSVARTRLQPGGVAIKWIPATGLKPFDWRSRSTQRVGRNQMNPGNGTETKSKIAKYS